MHEPLGLGRGKFFDGADAELGEHTDDSRELLRQAGKSILGIGIRHGHELDQLQHGDVRELSQIVDVAVVATLRASIVNIPVDPPGRNPRDLDAPPGHLDALLNDDPPGDRVDRTYVHALRRGASQRESHRRSALRGRAVQPDHGPRHVAVADRDP
jgi:hypothetical protein